MSAPTPVSSLVHSSTLVTAGLVFFWSFSWLLSYSYFGVFLIVLRVLRLLCSGLLALFEVDAKKLVALSTLSQISFCLFSLSLGFREISFLHVLTHAFIKCGLFLQLGYLIYIQLGQQDSRSFFVSTSYLLSLTLFLSVFMLCGLLYISGGITKELVLGGFFLSSSRLSFLIFVVFILSLTFFYSLRLLFFTCVLFSSYYYVSFRIFRIVSILCLFPSLFLLYSLFLSAFFTSSFFFNVSFFILFFYLLFLFSVFFCFIFFFGH